MRRKALFRRRRRRAAPALLLAALVVGVSLAILAALVMRPSSDERRADEVGPLHVHALGVNPGDEALFIAAHTGLFRLQPGASSSERVGDSYQDTMGFTVLGRNRFLGSGHPDVRDREPPLLGLIGSKDSGESWRSISLSGKADFHVLRVHGRQVVGYDASGGRVMVSRDSGESWRASHFDGPMVDLVISPRGPQELLATTPSQVILSRDGGRSWGGLSEATGLLAWPREDRLYLLAPDGLLWVSPDLGKRWRALGEIGGNPGAFLVSGRKMYAALHDGVIKESRDGGASWRLLVRPS